jgi:hypothetical protein
MKETLQWTSPSPLWPFAAGTTNAGTRRDILRRPAILRFAADTFMEDAISLLATDPMRLHDLVAVPETWRGPSAEGDPPKPIPLFARSMNRLGLAAKRPDSTTLVSGGKGISSLLKVAGAAQPRKFKLYQPAHQRHYLVTSSLVCGRAGLPDHAVNPGRQERVTFVLRRMFPPGSLNINAALPEFDANTWEEYAFVTNAGGNSWKRISREKQRDGGILIEGEDQLPLFGMNYSEDDGRPRRLFAGLVPVGKREAYMAGMFQHEAGDPAPVVTPQSPIDPRMHLFWSQVTEPWKKLLEQGDGNRMKNGTKVPDDPTDTPTVKVLTGPSLGKTLKIAREQIQTGSWYILLDFANLLSEQIPRVWKTLSGQPLGANEPPINGNETALISAITATTFDLDATGKTDLRSGTSYQESQIKNSLKDALVAAKAKENDLEAVKSSYDRANPDSKWPAFLFPLADPVLTPPLPKLAISATGGESELAKRRKKIDKLAEAISAALPAKAAAEVPANPLLSQQPMDMREGWFVMRCVFERPECGPIDPPLLSEPTRAFQMASFFDPDAPARPIRIALPLDTSPAGLRKFDKNTAFMISDMLCGQIDRLKGLSLGDLVLSVLPWPFHQDLPVPDGGPCKSDAGLEVGMICSLSIPIITICALILLMIIVNLLDIIFRWVPFFLFCFPLPKFKAKS